MERTNVSVMLYVKQSDDNGENGEREHTYLHLNELHELLQRLEAAVGVTILLGGSCGEGGDR
jgi:hypothetical protein